MNLFSSKSPRKQNFCEEIASWLDRSYFDRGDDCSKVCIIVWFIHLPNQQAETTIHDWCEGCERNIETQSQIVMTVRTSTQSCTLSGRFFLQCAFLFPCYLFPLFFSFFISSFFFSSCMDGFSLVGWLGGRGSSLLIIS